MSSEPLHYISYPREWVAQDQKRLDATYRAMGAAGYLLGVDCPDTARGRLVRLGEVVEELRQALGLSEPIVCKYKRPTTRTNSTPSTTSRAPGGGRR
jgi:hypothetical protein